MVFNISLDRTSPMCKSTKCGYFIWLFTLRISIIIFFPSFRCFCIVFLHRFLSFSMPTIRECLTNHKNNVITFLRTFTEELFYLSLWASKCENWIDLPENIAQSVAISTENSTAIAPVSLNTITGTNTIIPMANRLHVPDGIISKSLFFVWNENEIEHIFLYN